MIPPLIVSLHNIYSEKVNIKKGVLKRLFSTILVELANYFLNKTHMDISCMATNFLHYEIQRDKPLFPLYQNDKRAHPSFLCDFDFSHWKQQPNIPWRREWLPTLVFFPGEFHGQRSLEGYSLWGCKEMDTTEQLTLHRSLRTNLIP